MKEKQEVQTITTYEWEDKDGGGNDDDEEDNEDEEGDGDETRDAPRESQSPARSIGRSRAIGQTVKGQRESGWGRNGTSESWQEDTLHFRRHCGSIIAAAESQLLFSEVSAFFLFFIFLFFLLSFFVLFFLTS